MCVQIFTGKRLSDVAPLRQAAGLYNKKAMRFLKDQLQIVLLRPLLVVGFALFLTLFLIGCGGPRQLVARHCPSMSILTTVDVLPDTTAVLLDGTVGKPVAQIRRATLICFKDVSEDVQFAKIRLQGLALNTGNSLPVFVAVLDKKDMIVMRTQYQINTDQSLFDINLPRFDYDKVEGAKADRRLVVGFVLNEAQLAYNRARFAVSIGLGN